MRNPKTTICAIVAGCGQSIALLSGIPHWLAITAQVMGVIGTVCLGCFARDAAPPANGTL